MRVEKPLTSSHFFTVWTRWVIWRSQWRKRRRFERWNEDFCTHCLPTPPVFLSNLEVERGKRQLKTTLFGSLDSTTAIAEDCVIPRPGSLNCELLCSKLGETATRGWSAALEDIGRQLLVYGRRNSMASLTGLCTRDCWDSSWEISWHLRGRHPACRASPTFRCHKHRGGPSWNVADFDGHHCTNLLFWSRFSQRLSGWHESDLSLTAPQEEKNAGMRFRFTASFSETQDSLCQCVHVHGLHCAIKATLWQRRGCKCLSHSFPLVVPGISWYLGLLENRVYSQLPFNRDNDY